MTYILVHVEVASGKHHIPGQQSECLDEGPWNKTGNLGWWDQGDQFNRKAKHNEYGKALNGPLLHSTLTSSILQAKHAQATATCRIQVLHRFTNDLKVLSKVYLHLCLQITNNIIVRVQKLALMLQTLCHLKMQVEYIYIYGSFMILFLVRTRSLGNDSFNINSTH